ncbi:MAG: cytochrome c family protein [Proteobacteria bacterium]|nr:cytochrome c family protein [Pseudomonadota bacterium]
MTKQAVVGILYLVIFPFSLECLAAEPWIAFGDIRGHFEPCGCDPATDLGGMPRLDAYIRLERLENPKLKVFSLGNSYSTNLTSVSEQKNTAINSALSLIAPDISLLNRAELLNSRVILPSIKYVLSNHRVDRSSSWRYKTEFRVGSFLVYGFVEPFRGYPYLNSFKVSAWRNSVLKSKKLEARNTVLLYSGSKQTLEKIIRSRIFDTVIASNDRPLESEFGDEERADESKLVFLRTKESEILKTPLGGQGVLRSPDLQGKPAPLALGKIIAQVDIRGVSDKNCDRKFLGIPCVSSSGAVNLINRSFVTWLIPDYSGGVSGEMQQVVQGSREAASLAMKDIVIRRAQNLPSSEFLGSDACITCHESAYKVWSASKHSVAFATIKKVGRTEDPDCVSCHVVGFEAKGGFASEQLSPHLANVQCESCHGARKEHVLNRLNRVKVDAKLACFSCHTPPHSPRFNFSSYWEKISHK